MSKKLEERKEDFIKKAKELYGDRYTYEKVVYKNNNTKVLIYCTECKEYFLQTPGNFLQGHACQKCSAKARIKWDLEKFIQESIKVHGERFSYEETVWNGYTNKLKVRCTVCGTVIERLPQNHLRGQGCEECYKERLSTDSALTKEEFIKRSKEKFGEDKFDYSKVDYINLVTPIILICKIHGEFKIEPKKHLWSNYGCPECNSMAKSKKLQKVDIDNKDVVEGLRKQLEEGKTYAELAESYNITAHALGQIAQKLGLSSIRNMNGLSSGERNTIQALKELSIAEVSINKERENYIEGRKANFVIPDFKFVFKEQIYWIEYNGEQHYKLSGFQHTLEDFENQLKRDRNVREYCKNNNIILIEIPYIINTYEKVKDFLDKTLLQGIDPNTLVDYNKLYKLD